ncbi:hypothetical protein [Pendulispora albinea]|uniref:Uncharacterized protein n=1 Tax=Pendulispora albinea TaxID=2741071 RepID=A0ABZ2LRA5_9BACT
MADSPTPLRHAEPEKRDDATLAQEAQAHLGKSPALQLVAELLQKLRVGGFTWWTPEQVRSLWPASVRMGWLAQRPDIRQRITTGLTGLAPRAARNKTPEFQGALIDSVIEDGDVSVKQFDDAFTVEELAVYGPTPELWSKFRERTPWDQDTPSHQELVAWLFEAFLASQSSIGGHSRKPILTSLALRTAIPGKIWHTRIPLEVRVAIDDLRFQREKVKPSEAFHAIHDLSVATPSIIASNIALRELTRVVDVAEKSMGYNGSVPGKPATLPMGANSGVGNVPSQPGLRAASATGKSEAPKGEGAAGAAGGGNANATTPTPGRAAADEDFAFDDDPDSDEKTAEHAGGRKREPVADAKRQ